MRGVAAPMSRRSPSQHARVVVAHSLRRGTRPRQLPANGPSEAAGDAGSTRAAPTAAAAEPARPDPRPRAHAPAGHKSSATAAAPWWPRPASMARRSLRQREATARRRERCGAPTAAQRPPRTCGRPVQRGGEDGARVAHAAQQRERGGPPAERRGASGTRHRPPKCARQRRSQPPTLLKPTRCCACVVRYARRRAKLVMELYRFRGEGPSAFCADIGTQRRRRGAQR